MHDLVRPREEGQVLVIFVLALVAMIGMVGLVIDGGSAFAQRRDEQNVADLAAVAGATAYLNTTGDDTAKTAAADAAARAIAADNGYATDATTGTTVDVVVDAYGPYANVRVGVIAQHRNNFAGVLGMPTWTVATEATAISSGEPNAAIGALPLIFNEEAFEGAVCTAGAAVCDDEVFQEPGTGNEDVPQDATQFNWTIFCQANGNPCNADSDGVRDLIDVLGTDAITVTLGMDIGPLNAGSHTTLFTALEGSVGNIFPVPVVDDDGDMVGFAYFRLTGVEGASQKVIRGYFVAPYNGGDMTFIPGGGSGTFETGAYVVKLID
jgi:Flp pilus assembly protein TadG